MRVATFALSTAALVVTGSAGAADLPTRKAEPVEYDVEEEVTVFYAKYPIGAAA